jgi:amidophosphoribosyltransferase
MEQLKHECGVAMIRLLKPIEYYKQKYGSYSYALDRLYLLMEKQHNRGQEAAGVGVVKMHALPGSEYFDRERALGTAAIDEIFEKIGKKMPENLNDLDADEVDIRTPFIGQTYMGHLRYSTTGRSGLSYAHPFLRRNNWRSRALMLCGNFNMTNVDKLFDKIVATGQHPRLNSDTIVLLEQIGYALDKENHRLYREYRDKLEDPDLSLKMEDELDMTRVLSATAPAWDGGFVICGATGSGNMFALRDKNGIRPAFYFANDEIVVVASERPVIQTVFNVHISQVKELEPGSAIIVTKDNKVSINQILPQGENQRCSFERIYFSRGSDADIYKERKALGSNLADEILRRVNNDLKNTVFSFIPNTAEVAFIGMVDGIGKRRDENKLKTLLDIQKSGRRPSAEELATILDSNPLRIEKIAIKDIKLRTFIAEDKSRRDLAAHVYDVTYGCVHNDVDNLVIIDDSIVRGTTLQQSILRILDRLHPRRIIIVSSSPQVRYPDYYGIDMPRLSELIAFRAAIELLKRTGREHIIEETYNNVKAQLEKSDEERINCVKAIYEPFTDDEIARCMVDMLRPDGIKAEVEILFQTMEGLHEAIPNHPGDWYFSGNYPTPGGTRLVSKAFIDFYENDYKKK